MDAKLVANKILDGSDVRTTISKVSSESSYIKHYSGKLGEFDYDTREFEIYLNGCLHYMGTETDGSKIKIPNGVKDCSWMFYECESLITPPVIPNSVKSCDRMFKKCYSLTKAPVIPDSVIYFDFMFDYCSEEVQKAGKWNIGHRGQSYYDHEK